MPNHGRRSCQILILAAVAACPAAVEAQTECGPGQWVLRSTFGPPARYSPAMAYDSKRGVTVLFGGSAYTTIFGDTWEWDGNVWTQRLVAGPPARAGHAMAYDSARGVCVVFGGAGKLDTWEWDGASWSLRSTSGIANGRSGAAMAYDIARARTVLFGGSWIPSFPPMSQAMTSGETFEWDGAAWALRGNGPYQLHGTAMAYDSAQQRTIAFGGRHPNFKTSTTYDWTGRWASGWTTEPHPPGPAPFNRYAAAMSYNSTTHAVVMFGGFTCNDIWGTWNPTGASETWEHIGTTWVRRGTSGPVRQNSAMAYDSARDRVVMFGGMPIGGMTGLGDTWEWESPGLCYPDCDGDGALSLSDFGCFQTRFGLACNYADCNGDGVRNLADFGCFQTKFALGCP